MMKKKKKKMVYLGGPHLAQETRSKVDVLIF